MTDRHPYVGEGADGCMRSAQMDRERAERLPPSARRDELFASAVAWENQAKRVGDTEPLPPTFAQFIRSRCTDTLNGPVVVDAGVLSEPQHGQPAGTPFVVIETMTAMGREMAQQRLAACCANTDLHWEHGWWEYPARPMPEKGLTAEAKSLVLYPSDEYEWADHDARGMTTDA